jgi:hypothetical protein
VRRAVQPRKGFVFDFLFTFSGFSRCSSTYKNQFIFINIRKFPLYAYIKSLLTRISFFIYSKLFIYSGDMASVASTLFFSGTKKKSLLIQERKIKTIERKEHGSKKRINKKGIFHFRANSMKGRRRRIKNRHDLVQNLLFVRKK